MPGESLSRSGEEGMPVLVIALAQGVYHQQNYKKEEEVVEAIE
jgi:hypothetical protein